ncbi:MAG TPA: ATP-dependent sacrificial sulfur transferase LarE [Candidatus Nitrosopolaris sp.]|nr:ATP-dependent sacrificial sulfur transferase LarE [Candidatus Nitrosopolaris sp.]
MSQETDRFPELVQWFSKNGTRVIVALSGGVDSAVVALAAKKACGDKAIAVTANYKTLSQEELSSAFVVAKEIGIRHRLILYDEVANSDFAKNDQLRCYHCRKELGMRLLQEASKLDANLIVDGTHLDDIGTDRPGIRAMEESNVKSPMLELAISKAQIRMIARKFNLSIHDKPSNSCLASRIPQGSTVTYEKLARIEKSETIVKQLFPLRQVRVRDHGEVARIEVQKDEINLLFNVEKLEKLDTLLKGLGFKYVAIDAKGYRTGSLVLTPI